MNSKTIGFFLVIVLLTAFAAIIYVRTNKQASPVESNPGIIINSLNKKTESTEQTSMSKTSGAKKIKQYSKFPGELTAEELLNLTLEKYGQCDVVCVNAGIIESNSIENIDIDKMCMMMRLKVEMAFRLIYTFLKYFKKVGKGHVIITSSVMGTKTRENSGAYAACNYALEALAESLRMELSDTDIKITCIEPGLVETNLHNEWEIKPKELLNISNALQPEDIAKAVVDILEMPEHIRIPKYMILPKGHKI
jgi:hypothetical protein